MGFPKFVRLHAQNIDLDIIQSAWVEDDEIIASPVRLSTREYAGTGVEARRFVGYVDKIDDQFPTGEIGVGINIQIHDVANNDVRIFDDNERLRHPRASFSWQTKQKIRAGV
jgi:hypothetical protein